MLSEILNLDNEKLVEFKQELNAALWEAVALADDSSEVSLTAKLNVDCGQLLAGGGKVLDGISFTIDLKSTRKAEQRKGFVSDVLVNRGADGYYRVYDPQINMFGGRDDD